MFFAAMFALPILVILLAEFTLRLIGYGPDLSLFITEQIRGTTYSVMNPAVGARYFTGREFIPAPSTEYFLVPKPAGTYRIFCLGGSTVVGFPYWHNASFASFLRERLNRLFPDRQIEVINLGLTAVNSYTVLDIARELPGYGADLLIVYDGHNEFYGALGAASNDLPGSSRTLTFLYLRLVHSRLFLALRDGYVWIRSQFGSDPGALERGPTLELLARGQYIPYGSREYVKAQGIFRANLEDLRSLAAASTLPVPRFDPPPPPACPRKHYASRKNMLPQDEPPGSQDVGSRQRTHFARLHRLILPMPSQGSVSRGVWTPSADEARHAGNTSARGTLTSYGSGRARTSTGSSPKWIMAGW
jgi:hypothetical protein